jgi:hypothetical protein
MSLLFHPHSHYERTYDYSYVRSTHNFHFLGLSNPSTDPPPLSTPQTPFANPTTRVHPPPTHFPPETHVRAIVRAFLILFLFSDTPTPIFTHPSCVSTHQQLVSSHRHPNSSHQHHQHLVSSHHHHYHPVLSPQLATKTHVRVIVHAFSLLLLLFFSQLLRKCVYE